MRGYGRRPGKVLTCSVVAPPVSPGSQGFFNVKHLRIPQENCLSVVGLNDAMSNLAHEPLAFLIWKLVAIGYGLGALYLVVKVLSRLSFVTTSPLRRVPGPFLARFTRFWYLKAVARGDFEKTNVELHKRYGILKLPVVSW
jgi:hypothetical protein